MIREKSRIQEMKRDWTEEWRRKTEGFVETQDSNGILDILKDNQMIVIRGSPGSGKTVTAYHTAFQLEKFNYNIVPAFKPNEIIKFTSDNGRAIFIFDDPFGKFSLDTKTFEKWEKVENIFNINNMLKLNPELKIIFTCRSQIITNGIFKKYWNSAICYQIKLGMQDKKTIAKKLCGNYPNDLLNDNLYASLPFFPLLCNEFSSKYCKVDNLKICTNEIMCKEITYLERKGRLPFLTLGLIVVFNNVVQKILFKNGQKKTNLKKIILSLIHECEFDIKTSENEILDTFKNLKGTYFYETDEAFIAISTTMFDCIVSNMGRYFCRTILHFANKSFFKQRITFQSLKPSENVTSISLPVYLENKYFDRIIKILRKGNIKDAFINVQSINPDYRSKLIQYCTERGINLTNSEDDYESLYVCSKFGYSDIAKFILKTDPYLVERSEKSGVLPLHVACKYGYFDVALTLLEHKSNINKPNKNTYTPLHICCLHGHNELAKQLIGSGAKINLCSSIHGTPIFVASINQHLEVVNTLLRNGADVNKGLVSGFTPLHAACEKNKKETVLLLLKEKEADIRINAVDGKGRTPLYIACKKGYHDLAEILLLHKPPKAALNKADSKGLAPLHTAVIGEHFSVTELLIRHGAEVDIRNKKGFTPLYLTCQNGNLNILKLLLIHKADVNGGTKEYYHMPLYAAYENNHNSIVNHLLQQVTKTTRYLFLFIACFMEDINAVRNLLQNKNICIDINYIKYGLTVLCIASEKGNAELVSLLLQYKPNINMQSKTGWTPLCLACQKGNKTSVDLLIKHEASVNVPTELQLTPLFISCLFCRTELIDTLLHHNASVNEGDPNGWTPLKISSYLGLTDVVDKLLHSKALVNLEEVVEWKAERETRSNDYRHRRVTRIVEVHKKRVNNNFKIKQTPLCISIWQSNKAAVYALLDSGADVNQGIASDDLALTFNACENYVKSRRYNDSFKDTCNEIADLTPLQIACYNKKTDVIKRLLRNKAAVNFFSPTGIVTTEHLDYSQFVDKTQHNAKSYPLVTPLSLAIKTGQIKVLKKLLENKAKTNLQTSTGCLPLHLAIQKYDETYNDKMIQLLLDRKYNCEVNRYMQGVGTPLYLACSKNQHKIVEMLIRKKANVNKVGKDGQTALQISCEHGSKNIVRILLENRAELFAKNQRGPNPLELTKTDYPSIYALLTINNVSTRSRFGKI